MAKFKHNKKKNSAFLYETLILELTKAILRGDAEGRKEIAQLIKESFRRGSALYSDLKLYHSLSNTHNIHPYTAEKILVEVKEVRKTLNKKKLLSEQNNLIRKIKKSLPAETMSNFVPNYKTFATIYQIFNKQASIKTRILLETEIISKMSRLAKDTQEKKMVPIDNIIYKTFANKFNEEYSNELLSEQKELLSKFISSFSDNGLLLKTYLNEEISRLKIELKKSLIIEEIANDEEMKEKTKNIISTLESYKRQEPEKNMVQQVIKIQSLVQEIKENAVN